MAEQAPDLGYLGSGGRLPGDRPVFTDEELESLRRFPEIGREELLLRTNIGNVAALNPTGRRKGKTIIRVRP